MKAINLAEEEFQTLLDSADAIQIDDGAILHSWNLGDDSSSFIDTNWTEGDLEYDVVIEKADDTIIVYEDGIFTVRTYDETFKIKLLNITAIAPAKKGL